MCKPHPNVLGINATELTCRFVDRDMMMRYRGGGVGHKSTRNATNVFLKDRDPLDYSADQPNPLSHAEDFHLPDWSVDYNDEGVLELSDDEEEQLAEKESDIETEPENQNNDSFGETDGRLTMEEELGFSSL